MPLDEQVQPVNQGTTRPQAAIAFGTFVETQWNTLVLPTFKRSTQHGYKAVLNVHVLPAWHEWRLRDIERLAIQQWVAEKFRQRRGWQTVRNAWCCSRAFSKRRSNTGYLSVNPARGVKFPQQELKEKPAIIAGDSFAKLLTHLEEPYRTMVSLIAATGLRIGELLGLRWRALDLDIGTLAVRESVFEGKCQPPKTQRALRTIPLGPRAIAALIAHHQRVSRRAARGSRVRESKRRSLARIQAAENVLQPAAVAAGLGRVTWHQFRHIHSSLLNDLKVPVKIAQEQLGHASISTTLNIYTHVVDASHRQAVEAVESAVVYRTGPKWTQIGDRAEKASPVSARSA